MTKFITAMTALLAAGAAWCANNQGLPAFRAPDCLGVNIHFTSGQQDQVAQIAAAGFKFIRMDFFWSHIEKKKGEYDFSEYDALVNDLARHGIRPLFILDYGNGLYDNGLAPHTDEGRAAFARFAAAGAAHFAGKGVLWELWNEPNLTKFWQPDANPENYVKLARIVYPALKKADPDCTLLGPALSGWDFGYLEKIFQLGVLDNLDVVSLHPYGSARPEEAERYYATVRSLIARYAPKGRDIPYLSGEWGYTAVGGFTVEQQGQYIARQFLVNMMNGARLSIWYDWRDDGPDPDEGEHHFGTVYLDRKEKPAYFAAQTLLRELDGYSFATRISADSDNDYLALFHKGDDYRLAAWTIGDPHSIDLPLDVDQVEIVSLTGERRQVEVKNGILKLDLTGSVQYVEPLSKSRRWAMEAAWKVDANTSSENGAVTALISSRLLEQLNNPRITASGTGLGDCTVGPDGTCKAKYVTDGGSRAKVTVTLHVDGLKQPLVRVVELNTSACPTIDILPPTNSALLIAVKRPAAVPEGEYKGTLMVGNTQGLLLEKEAIDFSIPDGEQEAIVRFPMRHAPAGEFIFACRLEDEHGSQVLRSPARRYALLESFADGPAGQPVTKFGCELDGDREVPAEAKLTYVKAPPGAAADICAKLEYKFDDGWRFVRVSPRPTIPIAGSPKSVKIWIKGDGKDGLARLRFTDSDNQTFQPDYGRIDFTDWRCLTADLTGAGAGHWGGKNDGKVRYPIRWDTLFLLDNAGGRKNEGGVYLGPMMVCYD